MLELHRETNKLEKEMYKKLSTIAEGIDLALQLGDIIKLDEMDNALKAFRKNYAKEIIKHPEFIDRTINIYAKMDKAKRQLVNLYKQQRANSSKER